MPSIIKASPPLFARETPDGDTVWYFVTTHNDETISLRRLVLNRMDQQFRDYPLARPTNNINQHVYRLCSGVTMTDVTGEKKNAARLVSQIPDTEMASAIGRILRSKR